MPGEGGLQNKETSRRGIFIKEYYAECRFLRKESRSKANLQMERDQPKGTLNKRYQPKVDFKGAFRRRRPPRSTLLRGKTH